MSSLDDLAGWESEIEDYRISDIAFKVPNRVSLDSQRRIPKLPYEVPIKLAELMLNDKRLRTALEKKLEWDLLLEENPDMGPDHPDWTQKPYEAHRLISKFSDWYAIKVSAPHRIKVWEDCAVGIAFSVLRGETTSVRSEQTKSYIKDFYREFFSEEGDH
ncbi:hypothetical protein AB838_12660 [Rhodobacteraceae bacterium (ex Bugula neritina AB1)]|nr:hypothetical protein AB838_12660 [Rhodobacteraceae bacterium (ex Bugula neritina AB1)]